VVIKTGLKRVNLILESVKLSMYCAISKSDFMKRIFFLLTTVLTIAGGTFTLQAGGHGGGGHGGGCWGGGWHGGYCGGWHGYYGCGPSFSVGFYYPYYSYYPAYYSYPAYYPYYYPAYPAYPPATQPGTVPANPPSNAPQAVPGNAPANAPTALSTQTYAVARPYRPGMSSSVPVEAPLTPMAPRPAYVYGKPATPSPTKQYASVPQKPASTSTKTTTSNVNQTTAATQPAAQITGYAVAH
jgi:hypothetical protein